MGFIYQVPETVGGTVLIIERIESQNYVPGVSGWVIRANGDAEFNDLTARGDLLVGDENAQHILIALDPVFPFRPTISFFTGAAEDFPGQILSSDPAATQLALIFNAPTATGALGTPQLFMATEAGLPGSTILNSQQVAVFCDNLLLDASASLLFSRPALFETTWTGIPLAGTWVDVAGARAHYFKDASGRVQLRGQVVGGAGPGIGNLPVGYRPTQTMEWIMRGVGGVVLCAVSVSTAGVITATANAATAQAAGVKLDSISFPAQF